MNIPRARPGLPISAAAHAGLLAATLIAFAQAPKFAETPETVPVEVVTDAQLNQIMKGEKTAPAVKPAQRAEKVSEQVETHPHPAQAEAKRDIPTPPPSFKRVAEPSDDDAPEKPEKAAPTPPKRVAALTPEPPTRPAPAAKPVPTPPVKAQAKAAPDPEEDKPDDAEVVKPKPPVKPKLEKVEKEVPTPPAPPQKPKETPRLKTDEVAKLLQRKKLDKTAEDGAESDNSEKPKSGKPKSGDETAPKSKFSTASIANLLSREAPQQRASTGRERTQLASLGAPTASAAKMSPSLQGRIDSYTVEHYRRCWATALSMNAMTYVPRVEFRLSRVGALEGEPRLLNPSSNPVEKARGEQALAAVRRCSPMQIPAEFTPFYDYWRVTELDMKEDM
ncbi:MAG: cell envelope biogenesis protein TolA [Methylocystis sp.]